jgi:hypothetical protein
MQMTNDFISVGFKLGIRIYPQNIMSIQLSLAEHETQKAKSFTQS